MLGLSAGVAYAADASGAPDDTNLSGSQVVSTEPSDPKLGTVRDYLLRRDDDTSPLGIDVRADRLKLKSGEEKLGLLVVAVADGGPAAKAGVRGVHRRLKNALEVASVAGAFFFPPAVILVPVLESTPAGESYDLIVAVDGYRVNDLLDFEDCMRDVKPGENHLSQPDPRRGADTVGGALARYRAVAPRWTLIPARY